MVKMMCSVLDIPVHENPIESLHLLFTLYLEFRNNPIFGQQAQMADMEGWVRVRAYLCVCV